ncbi:MAG: phosphate ABC transporter permease subunit PstC [Chloroflexota bacterium]|nr:phosphate ABC transporter permease subunit PstC [Chloroflexota bacterium]MDE2961980.1 phosphate ABC transporter permease subunit PstC [Chloroflexota bacterium]
MLTTVAIVSVLLFEGVRFFTSDFYENRPTERVATSEAEGLAGAAPSTLSPGSIPKVQVRATTDSLIYVNWEPPTVGQAVTGYEVSVLPVLNADISDCTNLPPDRISCVIANAAPGRSHKVTVAAVAGQGKGVGLETDSFSVPEKVKWHRFLTDTKWRTLLVPRSYGIWPLLVGTTMIAVLAMVVAVPFGLLSAIFLSEYAHPRLRAITKPILEVLAGIPTVVYGFFALFFITPILRSFSDDVGIFNALSAAIVMGVMIIPMVSSLSEDAMRAVPNALREGAYALGATKVEVAIRVVLPAALSGIVAAIILAMSRAIGETMIVFIAAGQNDKLTFNPLDPVNTMTGFMATTNFSDNAIPGTAQFQALFAVGITLFIITLCMNLLSQFVVAKFREVYE